MQIIDFFSTTKLISSTLEARIRSSNATASPEGLFPRLERMCMAYGRTPHNYFRDFVIVVVP